MGTLHSPKFQHYLILIIRLFSVICRTLMGGVLLPNKHAVGVFSAPAEWATRHSLRESYPTAKI